MDGFRKKCLNYARKGDFMVPFRKKVVPLQKIYIVSFTII